MRANALSLRVDSQTTLDAVPVVVDAVLSFDGPMAPEAAHASLSEMIASSTLAALMHPGVGRTPVCDARIVRVSVPAHLQACNDACLLAALADVRQRYRRTQ